MLIHVGERVRKLREHLGYTQDEFASKLGLTRNFISLVETGQRILSDRSFLSIVREFGVDENWLRTSEGEMLRPVTRDTELAAFFGNLQSSTPDFRHQLISVLSRLTVDEWAMLERKAKELLAEIQKDSP